MRLNHFILHQFIIVLLCSNSIFCQNISTNYRVRPHGTLIVGAICKDGILFASDSRASFTVGQGSSVKAYAFYENDQKIFTLGKFKIGIAGLSMLNKKFMYDITYDFNKRYKENENIEKTFVDFIEYLKTNMQLNDSIIFAENTFIIAGYENSKPIILGVNSSKRIRIDSIGRMGHSDEDFKGYLQEAAKVDLICSNLTPILASAFVKFSNDKKNNTVGGPIQIIQIKPDNTCIELKSFNPIRYKSYKKMAKAILRNKLKVKYIYPESKDLLWNTLKEGIRLGY